MMKDIFLKLMFNILKNDMKFILICHFYQKERKLKTSKSFAANLHCKTEYVIQIRNLKQVLKPGLVFKKFHKVIKFNQNAWLKPYIDMNTDF